MGRLLLLDGHSLAYRAFFALPAENFATATGQTTNAVFGFTSMLINLLRDEQPTHVAVGFDLFKPTLRLAEYPEYKAGRAKTPEEFTSQIPLIIEVLDAMGIRHTAVEQYEADDVIATLAARGEEAGHEVLVVSGDRDSMQMVTDRVTVLYPLRGTSELARLDPAGVEERYLVRPERYSDLAALVGEKADNLPGVPGVGAKTAAKWLNLYGDLSGIVAHADEIKGKAGQNLRDNLESVLRNRRLNQLTSDLALPVTIDDVQWQGPDREAVHAVFDALEFRVLRDRFFEVIGHDSGDQSTQSTVELEETVVAPNELGAWLDAHTRAGERVGVMVEGQWARGTGDAWAMAIAAPDNAAAYIDLESLTDTDEKAFAAWLADPQRQMVLHDAKGPLQALTARGYAPAGLSGDSSIAAYLVHPDQRSYDLGDLVMRHLHRELAHGSSNGQGMLDIGGGDDHAAASDAMARARAVLDLANALEALVDSSGGMTLYRDIELPLVAALALMERRGIAVDRARLNELEQHFADAVADAAQEAYGAIGHEVNLSSPKQLQVVLFEELDLPKTKKTKTGYTTDADALNSLFERTGHPFLEALLRHRDASKLRSTVEGLIKAIADDGRIHTTYQQTIAATGRLSSTDPNLQNIPIRTDSGRRIRSVFVPGHAAGSQGSVAYESVLSADYSQIEMRIMAHLSGDEGLIEAFRSGEDLHRFVGSRVFEVAPEDVTPAMRSKVKAMSYGLAYGLSAFGLSRQLKISTAEANTLMEGYFERFGGVRDYLAEVVEVARKQGYTETMLGRRRYLPDLTSSNRQRRDMAERMALNAPIQGSAADIIKIAMLRVEKAIDEAGIASRVLLQVHDELVVEVAPGEKDQVSGLIHREMGGAIDLSVPLVVNIGVGDNWQTAAH
ncbi:DNA polymerase I [Dermatophilus congolensis]|uniref:DNA polymerase I n=1 Tax=Dermatophilus congolensis TaxID=1863 RepID=UPI001AAF1411|nr:DNA polymerase I [Dermatophilus congolensis]MBO3131853.1 DNA polymerase I [Dermatophilus congolensis]MBO3133990.1 DNA polymerase I [Dermatophilus congolensis]MBO3136221.1 DNA polymerase I [Dermatophilus congolensis]MBO3138467.1 DNA polymerase I [Dermatophilus congolensis]